MCKTDCLCFRIKMFHTDLSWILCNINGMEMQLIYSLWIIAKPSKPLHPPFTKIQVFETVYLEVFDT